MGQYKRSRFEVKQIVADSVISRNPANHPTDMGTDMQAILNSVNATVGAWHIVKYISNTSPFPGPVPENKFYVAFFAMKNGEIDTQAAKIAAPCPPFCGNEGASVLSLSVPREKRDSAKEKVTKPTTPSPARRNKKQK